MIAVLLSMQLAVGQSTAVAASGSAPVRSAAPHRVVVVDAGHGGPDNGMVGPLGAGRRLVEKTITLAVAKAVGQLLAERGVKVVYTRTTDTLIALSDRGRIANEAGGSLFLSIHVNAANPDWERPSAARGFETYFLSDAKTEDEARVAAMENASIRFEDVSKATGSAVENILRDMKQNQDLRESSMLGAAVQDRLGRVHPGPSRGVKQAGFRVLVTAYMPAVLIEIGFGSNPAEAAYLNDPAKQRVLARSITDAAIEYLEGYERRASGSRR